MDDLQTYTIFHIYRKDGTPLFLHPFQNPEFMNELIRKLDTPDPPVFKGLYGKEPRVESLTLFRNELYRIIEQVVNTWMAEKRFIPRFLFSAVVFLLTYFFCSVVIRDPIPMVDELIIGLAAGVGAYFVMGKGLKNSSLAGKNRIRLREMVDKIVFEQSKFLVSVEDTLQKNEALPPASLLENLVKGDSEDDSFQNTGKEGKNEIADELLKYLEARFDRDILKWYEKNHALKKGNFQKKGKVKGIKKVDLPLFSTYTKLKSYCHK